MPKFPTPPPSRAVSCLNSLPLLRLARSRAQIPFPFLFERPPCGLHKSIPRRPIPYRKYRRAFQGALYLTGSVEEHSKVPFTLPEVQESVMISMFIPTESQVFLSPSPVKKTPNKYRCLVDVLCVRDRELVVTSENVEKLDKQALM